MSEIGSSWPPYRNATPPEEIDRLASAAWHKRNVLVVDMSKVIIDPIHRQALVNVGNKLYGKRVQ